MIAITVRDSSGEDLEADITRIDNIEKQTTRNDNEYVQVTTRDGTRYSCWEDSWQEKLLANKETYYEGYWEICYVVKQGKYRNIKYVTEADEEQIEEAEANADPLDEVPRDVRIRKSTALNAASRVSAHGTPTAALIEKAKEIDQQFVEWLTEGVTDNPTGDQQ